MESTTVYPSWSNFNPHIHTRCDISRSAEFQSTHPHKMRRIGKLVEIMFHAISIHASVRNATSPLNIKLTINRISIHASVQNATSAHQDRYSSRADFNPRIRVECNGNNINDFRIPVYNVQFLNQSLTQFRVCFMSYLGDFRCESLRKFLRALSSHQGGVEPPTFILILYTKFIYLSRCY